MRKITIEHPCGHSAPHGLSGTEQERQTRAAWLARQPCPTCWRAAQLNQATARRDALSLPPLEGSPEEIAWAEVIRAKVIEHNRDYHRQLLAEDSFRDDPELDTLVKQTASEALRELESEPRAAWWLEHRFDKLSHVKYRIVAAIAPILNAREDDSGNA
jgi:hypothetical protein